MARHHGRQTASRRLEEIEREIALILSMFPDLRSARTSASSGPRRQILGRAISRPEAVGGRIREQPSKPEATKALQSSPSVVINHSALLWRVQ